jgi:anti-sigma regulatory factor (Ser/Thr protein kinase)
MGSLRTSPPPPRAVELRSWPLSTAAELRGLRASLHEALTGHALAEGEELDDIPERIVLVATELATNALLHGLPPTTVRLLRDEEVFILDVADHDLTNVPEPADDRQLRSGGRGLQLAQAFSLDVGWYATEDTKHIWASFPRREELEPDG